LLHNQNYSYAIDYWSIGVIAFELVHKEVMFRANSEIEALIMIFRYKGTPQYDKILGIEDYTLVDENFKVKFPKFKPQPHPYARRLNVPTDLKLIIDGMTEVDPAKRLNCEEALDILNF
jgi:serine/threonine protein kinase